MCFGNVQHDELVESPNRAPAQISGNRLGLPLRSIFKREGLPPPSLFKRWGQGMSSKKDRFAHRYMVRQECLTYRVIFPSPLRRGLG